MVRSVVGLLSLGLFLAGAGCATLPRDGRIPHGYWQGRGVYVSDVGSKPGDAPASAPADPKIDQRAYRTRLWARPATFDGKAVTEIEILSSRGKIAGLDDFGDSTHILIELAPFKRISSRIMLYQLVGAAFNPDPGERIKATDQPSLVTCSSADDLVILQMPYPNGNGFCDTMLFSPGHVGKFGMLDQPDDGYMVHWFESLRSGSAKAPPPRD